MLRTPSTGRLLVYGALIVFVALRMRPLARLSQFIVAVLVTAAVVRGGLAAFGTSLRSSGFAGALVPHLQDSVKFGNVCFLLLIGGGLALTLTPAKWRPIAGGVVTYVGMLAWENRLAEQGSIARQLLVGAALVAIMASRPQGVFGAKRVEVL
jgi:hypothetical protein